MGFTDKELDEIEARAMERMSTSDLTVRQLCALEGGALALEKVARAIGLIAQSEDGSIRYTFIGLEDGLKQEASSYRKDT